MTLRFAKAEGSLNDFVIIDDRARALDRATRKALAIDICDRRAGVGSDGLIVIEDSDDTDFTMCFYNPDGSDGAMCGNGGRCAVRYAHAHGLIARAACTFRVLDRVYRAEFRDDDIRVYFPPPRTVTLDMLLTGTVFGDEALRCHFIDTGAPHVVVFIDDMRGALECAGVDEAPVESLGSFLRYHEAFAPAGTNVDFADIDPDGAVFLRTYERGVEAETMSCGTGTIATALAAHLRRGASSPVTLVTRGGDTLTVGFDDNDWNGLYLEGPARMVFEGTYPIED